MGISSVHSHTNLDNIELQQQEAPKKLELEYSGASPVKEINHNDFAAVVGAFTKSVNTYATDAHGNQVSAPPSKYSLKYDPRKVLPAYQEERRDQKVSAQRWNDRSIDAREMARIAGNNIDPETRRITPGEEDSKIQAFSYQLAEDHSAGVMTLAHQGGDTEVKYLATHPGTSGAGETLIETAVNASQKEGNEGKISLTSLNSASSGFYRSLGFEGSEATDLKLDPSQSTLWEQRDGEWNLIKNRDKSYLAEKQTNEMSTPAELSQE